MNTATLFYSTILLLGHSVMVRHERFLVYLRRPRNMAYTVGLSRHVNALVFSKLDDINSNNCVFSHEGTS